MEDKKNNNHSVPESSAASEHRHEAAKDYTRKLVEEILSSQAAKNTKNSGGTNTSNS
ncbi:MAG: hypothetical protein IJS13_05150 [Paludibacteraceae bacterium]|nr:hypothetical protein [Paludibacteraceae bacterium]